jgi:hypothetical protein
MSTLALHSMLLFVADIAIYQLLLVIYTKSVSYTSQWLITKEEKFAAAMKSRYRLIGSRGSSDIQISFGRQQIRLLGGDFVCLIVIFSPSVNLWESVRKYFCYYTC